VHTMCRAMRSDTAFTGITLLWAALKCDKMSGSHAKFGRRTIGAGWTPLCTWICLIHHISRQLSSIQPQWLHFRQTYVRPASRTLCLYASGNALSIYLTRVLCSLPHIFAILCNLLQQACDPEMQALEPVTEKVIG
jgi:hypothetical protein